VAGTAPWHLWATARAYRRLAGEEAEPFEEVLARHEHRNKRLLQIGDVGWSRLPTTEPLPAW
jgi:hypothetical protein